MLARALLVRGMLVGVLAGLLMFGVGRLAGEPSVGRAIAFEAAADAAKAGHDHGTAEADAEPPELFSRATQSGIGLLTGVVVYGAAFGGLFGLVFAYAYGRIGSARPRVVAALLAGCGFVALSLVPMLVYPANPPAIGEPDTIAHRTALFFILLALSIAAMVGAVVLRRRLAAPLGAWNATLAAIAAYGAVVFLAGALLPAVEKVPADFPADVLWHFRIAALFMSATMWATLGLGVGWAAERLLAPGRHGPALMPTLVR